MRSHAISDMVQCTNKESPMPLSTSAARESLHTRSITIGGYRRADGLYDIEAHLTDVKSFRASVKYWFGESPEQVPCLRYS